MDYKRFDFGKFFFSFRLQGKFMSGLSVGPYINLTMSAVSEINDYAEKERIVNRFSWPEDYFVYIYIYMCVCVCI